MPVRSETADGALVIINFLDDEHSELASTLRTYAVVAVLSLGLITLLAALQSGRLLAPLRSVREIASDITTSDLSQRIPETGNDDITALTRTFNDMLDRLEDGVESQRRFLDDAGHELRTPLTVLRGHLELLDSDDHDEVDRDPRRCCSDEVDRMSRLVGDLILLAKSRRPDFVQLRHDGPRRADRCAGGQGPGPRRPGLGAGRRGASGTVLVDEQRVTQAVLALADNAVKHTRPRRPDRAGVGARPARQCWLWVEDSGAGVPAADRERIFERFGRAGVRPATRASGSGCRSSAAIAEAHGGTVGVRDAVPRRGALRAAPTRRLPKEGGPMARILILEDEERIAVVRGQGPARRGPPADGGRRRARQGSTRRCPASSTCSCWTSACPGSTGSRCWRQLRAQGSRLPVIVLTARDSVTDTVTALEGGADDYMPKPFRFAELLARVRVRLRQADSRPPPVPA